MLTDSPVLVRNLPELPALVCAQRKAEKRVSTEEDFIRSNIDSFGNEIGQTTNWITSMFEVRSRFEPGSKEYKTLSYRIQCGQLYQQNAIDKAKGIICKPMPRTWHDRHAVNKIEDEHIREFYRSIVADKKPYFMIYIYPALMKQYRTYIKNTNKNALREFKITAEELACLPEKDLTERQREFLRYYRYRMPVGTNDCIMNKICKRFEDEFDGHVGKHNEAVKFDYRFMRSDAEYSDSQYRAIKKLYDEYNRRLQSYTAFAANERIDKAEVSVAVSQMDGDFRRECDMICPNEDILCNIILDICYTKRASKRFAWNICGAEIIHNLLRKNNNTISFPCLDEEGDIEYCGNKFSMQTKKVEVE